MPSLPITPIIPRQQFTASGGQTVFNFTFIFFALTDITVYLTPNGTAPNDATQLILQPGAYTVTQNPVSFTGFITLTNPANAGDIITIVRAMPYQRLSTYIPGFGNFTPDAVNTDFESEVLMIQQNLMFEQVVTPRYNLTSAPVQPNDLILPILGANQVWGKDPTNTFIAAVSLPAGDVILPTIANRIPVFTNTAGTLADSLLSVDNAGNLTGVLSITISGTNYTNANIVRSVTGTANQINSTGGVTPTLSYSATSVFPGTVTLNADPTLALQAATKQYVDTNATTMVRSVTGTANQVNSTGGQNPVLSLSSTAIFPGTVTLNADPVSPLQAATKQYVDALAAGLTYKDAVVAATTGALTVVYNNGAAGVGATLTNAGAQAAFSTDGVSPAINSRILVKNQAANLQNGIYTLTTVGSGASNWVLTRAADFNTPAQIAPGDFVVVEQGSTLVSTAWIQGATVNNIGVDSITFTQLIIAGGVTSVTGTANQITSTGGTTPVIAMASNPIVPGTAGMTLPQGNTAARGGGAGTIRFNTQTTLFESTVDGATWANTGTVTSVTAATGNSAALALTGTNPITTSGTITFTPHGNLISRTILTSGTAQTYTVPAGINLLVVECLGGGGGGGGAAGAVGNIGAGGGGGSGAYCKKLIATTPASTFTYTVGAAVNGGAAGNNVGTAGNATTFSTISAGGGGGGGGSAASNNGTTITLGAGGAGGTPSGGDLNVQGESGGIGWNYGLATALSGFGGNSIYGVGAGGFATAANGATAGTNGQTNGGGGGSGGTTYNIGANAAGGNGGSGLIIVWEYA